MRCVRCNSEVNDTYKFCTNCGAALSENVNNNLSTNNTGNTVASTNNNGNNAKASNKFLNILVLILKILGGLYLLQFVIAIIIFGICMFSIAGMG